MANPVGRPLIFKSVEELQEKIDGYFAKTPEDEWTWTGLALYLDVDKETLKNYKEKPEFFGSIKRALDKVENGYEKDLKKHGRSGSIFALKNFEWKDRQEIGGPNGQPIQIMQYVASNPPSIHSSSIPTGISSNTEEV